MLLNLPDDVIICVLACLDFRSAYSAGRTCTLMYKLLLDRVAPEVAGGIENVPSLIPTESRLMRLAFLYAQKRTRGNHPDKKFAKSFDIGREDVIAIPIVLPARELVAQVVVGKEHMLVVNAAGKAYGAGSNLCSQLGMDLQSSSSLVPLTYDLNKRVIKAAAGGTYSMMLFTTGQAVGCGQTSFGELGEVMNDICPYFIPVFESLHQPILDIEAKHFSTAVITRGGELYVCGYNRIGWSTRYQPTRVYSHVVSCSLTVDTGMLFTAKNLFRNEYDTLLFQFNSVLGHLREVGGCTFLFKEI